MAIEKNFFPEMYKILRREDKKNGYRFYLSSRSERACCPNCGAESTRIHSYASRSVRDLPILGKSVMLHIRQKRYICANRECAVVPIVFTERNELVNHYSQFTIRCNEYMLKVASFVSCEAAVKILGYQGIKVSGDTLLNMIKVAGKEYKIPVGKNIGIDDWAYRRGQKYGTLICDLDTHEIVEILEGRDSETLEKWLRGHPEIEIVSRDRSSSYSSAVTTVLPQAVQIADRFHITQNLLEALNETMKGFIPEIIEVPVNTANAETPPTENALQAEEERMLKKI